MHVPLLFEAGRVAGQRGWPSPDVVPLSGIAELSPSGPPVIAVGEAGAVTVQTARVLAALVGAGRDVVLITERALADEVAAWLPANAHHILGEALDVANQSSGTSASVSATLPGAPPPMPAGKLYCTFSAEDSLAELTPARGGWVVESWRDFVQRHSLSVMDQGRADQVSAGGWRLGEDGCIVPLWFQPMRRVGGPSEFMLIGSTIGILENRETDVTTPEWQQEFADQVVSWCEQPEVAAMLNRVMGQFAAHMAPLGQRKSAEECFRGGHSGGVEPDRVLVTEDCDELQVQMSPTMSVMTPVGSTSRSLTFVYRIPATSDPEILDDVLSHAIDSLVRIHELLSDPASTLHGRRDSRMAGQLQGWLRGTGFVSYGALARMERTGASTDGAGRPSGPDGPALSRLVAIVAEAQEVLRNSPDPGWQPILQFGDIGFPAAVAYRTNGKWPTPQERAAIEQVYGVLCQSLSVDAQHEWASFEEMLAASAATFASQGAAVVGGGDPTSLGPLESVCRNCGIPAEAGDRFCGGCGREL